MSRTPRPIHAQIDWISEPPELEVEVTRLESHLLANKTAYRPWQPAILPGKCSNGYQRDTGKVVHAVTSGDESSSALCGKTHGRHSAGFATRPNLTLTCLKCIRATSSSPQTASVSPAALPEQGQGERPSAGQAAEAEVSFLERHLLSSSIAYHTPAASPVAAPAQQSAHLSITTISSTSTAPVSPAAPVEKGQAGWPTADRPAGPRNLYVLVTRKVSLKIETFS